MMTKHDWLTMILFCALGLGSMGLAYWGAPLQARHTSRHLHESAQTLIAQMGCGPTLPTPADYGMPSCDAYVLTCMHGVWWMACHEQGEPAWRSPLLRDYY